MPHTGIVDVFKPLSTASRGRGISTWLWRVRMVPNGSVAVYNVAGLTGSVNLFRYAMALRER